MIGNQTSPPTVYPYKTYDQIENYATQLPHYINNIRALRYKLTPPQVYPEVIFFAELVK